MRLKLFVLTILIFSILSPVLCVEAQTANSWVIMPDNSLYFVSETGNVMVFGPVNSWFRLNINSMSGGNETNIWTYRGDTGPTGNVTMKVEFYENNYVTGSYSLNVTYMDKKVAVKMIDVVFDTVRIEANKERIQNERIDSNTEVGTWNTEQIQDIWNMMRENVAPMAIAGFAMGFFAAIMVIVKITLPQQRYYNEQIYNSADASARASKKMEIDIIAVNGAAHPDVKLSQYQTLVASNRRMGYSDDYIDTMLSHETGNFAHTIKPIPVAYAWGGWLLLKGRKVQGDNYKALQIKKARDDEAKKIWAAKKALQKKLKKGEITGAEYDKEIKALDNPPKPVAAVKAVVKTVPATAENPDPVVAVPAPVKKRSHKRKAGSRKKKATKEAAQ